MSSELLQGIARGCYIAASILLLVAFLLFFRFKIWKIIGDLSGLNIRREIKAILKNKTEENDKEKQFWDMEAMTKDETEVLECEDETAYLESKTITERCYFMEKVGETCVE